jgi:teichuronic acid biosynthesis glycosyltransferase TuaC
LSVGHLIPRKAHDLVIRSLERLPDAHLWIAGAGPEERHLREVANSTGLTNRVTFLGAISQDGLRTYYTAADVLVLASSREGWANVLLEAMACGTPVVASNVWGTPEVVAAPEAGVLMDERSPEGVARAVRKVLERPPNREATRRYAEGFGWGSTTAGQMALFQRVLDSSRGDVRHRVGA